MRRASDAVSRAFFGGSGSGGGAGTHAHDNQASENRSASSEQFIDHFEPAAGAEPAASEVPNDAQAAAAAAGAELRHKNREFRHTLVKTRWQLGRDIALLQVAAQTEKNGGGGGPGGGADALRRASTASSTQFSAHKQANSAQGKGAGKSVRRTQSSPADAGAGTGSASQSAQSSLDWTSVFRFYASGKNVRMVTAGIPIRDEARLLLLHGRHGWLLHG